MALSSPAQPPAPRAPCPAKPATLNLPAHWHGPWSGRGGGMARKAVLGPREGGARRKRDTLATSHRSGQYSVSVAPYLR